MANPPLEFPAFCFLPPFRKKRQYLWEKDPIEVGILILQKADNIPEIYAPSQKANIFKLGLIHKYPTCNTLLFPSAKLSM